jgi:NAD(P)-dependent dehydrogenase (short-subunit alcohol dehydrogenase family)
MAVNLTGMFHGCKRAVRQMLAQEPRNEVRGRVINLGSQQGIVTSPHDTPRIASRSARSTGCRYAITANVSIAGADNRVSAVT